MYIETHMHISLDGVNGPKFREKLKQSPQDAEELIRNNILAYKQRGIYALRDGGDPINLATITRKVAEEEGIIYKTPIHAVYKRGYYGSLIGKGIDDLNDFKNLMAEIKKYKPDFIKIPLSGIMDFNVYGEVGGLAFSEEELDYIVKYANDNFLPVMIHVNSREGVMRAIKAGVSSIEHGYYMTEEELWALKEADIIWIPTLAPLGNILRSRDESLKEQLENIERIFNEQSANVKKAYEIGVKMAVGSDGGAYRVFHGAGFIDELTYMEEAGIPRDELEKIAFYNGLKALNINEKDLEGLRNE